MSKRAMKMIDRESTLEGLISDAMSEIQALAEEMREAFDNTPESLQNSGVGEARGEAADTLENISEPDLPDWTSEVVVKWKEPPPKKRMSRSARRDEAIRLLSMAVEELEKIVAQHEDADLEEEVERREAAEMLAEEVQNLIDEVDGVDFPGMYG